MHFSVRSVMKASSFCPALFVLRVERLSCSMRAILHRKAVHRSVRNNIVSWFIPIVCWSKYTRAGCTPVVFYTNIYRLGPRITNKKPTSLSCIELDTANLEISKYICHSNLTVSASFTKKQLVQLVALCGQHSHWYLVRVARTSFKARGHRC
jgi:hypothetical protein